MACRRFRTRAFLPSCSVFSTCTWPRGAGAAGASTPCFDARIGTSGKKRPVKRAIRQARRMIHRISKELCPECRKLRLGLKVEWENDDGRKECAELGDVETIACHSA